MRTPTTIPATIRGRAGFIATATGRWYPLIAGAEEPTAEEKAAAEKAEAEAAVAAAQKAKESERKPPTQDDLDKAYEKLRAAEKAASEGKAAQKKLAELESASLSETEKLKKEAEDGKALATKATDTLRTANLRLALAGVKEIVDPKAAAKLIDGVEYDDDHEPKNIDDRVKALLKEYPLLKGEKLKAPDLDSADKKSTKTPALTADELEMATSLGMTPEEYAAYKDPNPKLPAKKPAAK